MDPNSPPDDLTFIPSEPGASLAQDSAALPRSDPGASPELPQAEASYQDSQRLKRLLATYAGRQAESLKIYEPLPLVDRFHADARDERILRGSNRAGKTLGASVECARAVTGQDPYGKYPKANGRAFLVGLDEQHLADVMYRKLFRAGAFKMIRDEVSGAWRAYRPQTDGHRQKEAKPAPPLIPRRLVKEISWKDKKRGIPGLIRLTTGWELNFFSSKGSPPQGSDIDLWWIDEECFNEAWYAELAARILDREGCGWWSATPQIASQQLYDLHTRAEAGDPNVGEHIILLEDNPHITQAAKDKLEASIVSDEERRVRIKGEYAVSGFNVYPEFDPAIHGIDLAGPVPASWCRYLVVDPGRQVCAVLFGAVPPPEEFPDPCLVLYDELYIKHSDAEKFGDGVAGKSAGGVAYEAFVIDHQAGRITEMGSGKNVEEQFSEALKKRGIRSRRTGHTFIWGSTDEKAGRQLVHQHLILKPETGRSYLRVVKGRLPNFEWEIKRYRHRRVKGQPTDEVEKKNDHLMDCLRYLVMLEPRYVKPAPAKSKSSYAVRALKAKNERARKKAGPGRVSLGPRK
jgi:hypothetical protein